MNLQIMQHVLRSNLLRELLCLAFLNCSVERGREKIGFGETAQVVSKEFLTGI